MGGVPLVLVAGDALTVAPGVFVAFVPASTSSKTSTAAPSTVTVCSSCRDSGLGSRTIAAPFPVPTSMLSTAWGKFASGSSSLSNVVSSSTTSEIMLRISDILDAASVKGVMLSAASPSLFAMTF